MEVDNHTNKDRRELKKKKRSGVDIYRDLLDCFVVEFVN